MEGLIRKVQFNGILKASQNYSLVSQHEQKLLDQNANIINFAVKEQGLEAQLLGIVVRNERPELEEQKDALVLSIAAGKKKLVELEDQILK